MLHYQMVVISLLFLLLAASTSDGICVGSWLPATEYAILLPTLFVVLTISAILSYVKSSVSFCAVINCDNTNLVLIDVSAEFEFLVCGTKAFFSKFLFELCCCIDLHLFLRFS